MPDRQKLLLEAEIAFEQLVSSNRGLATFRRNPTTWELLLMLASKREGFTDGLHEVPNAISTRYLGPSALLKFVREQRDAGLIRFLQHEKRSKRILQLDPLLVQALHDILESRDEILSRVAADCLEGDEAAGSQNACHNPKGRPEGQ